MAGLRRAKEVGHLHGVEKWTFQGGLLTYTTWAGTEAEAGKALRALCEGSGMKYQRAVCIVLCRRHLNELVETELRVYLQPSISCEALSDQMFQLPCVEIAV